MILYTMDADHLAIAAKPRKSLEWFSRLSTWEALALILGAVMIIVSVFMQLPFRFESPYRYAIPFLFVLGTILAMGGIGGVAEKVPFERRGEEWLKKAGFLFFMVYLTISVNSMVARSLYVEYFILHRFVVFYLHQHRDFWGLLVFTAQALVVLGWVLYTLGCIATRKDMGLHRRLGYICAITGGSSLIISGNFYLYIPPSYWILFYRFPILLIGVGGLTLCIVGVLVARRGMGAHEKTAYILSTAGIGVQTVGNLFSWVFAPPFLTPLLIEPWGLYHQLESTILIPMGGVLLPLAWVFYTMALLKKPMRYLSLLAIAVTILLLIPI